MAQKKDFMNYSVLKKDHWSDAQGYQIIPIRPEDIEAIRQWRNEQIEVLRQKKSITEEEQKAYFDTIIWPSFKQKEPRQILFSILYMKRLIGYGGLTTIDWEAKKAEISFLVNPERVKDDDLYQRDYLHFLRLLSQVAFDDLQFHRLFAETYDFRKKHIEILEAYGFKKEGTLRDHTYKKGRWHHSIMHGLLVGDQ